MYISKLARCQGLTILLIFVDLTLAHWSSPGETQSFSCEAPKNENLSIQWGLYNGTTTKIIFICSIFSNTCTEINDQALHHYNANITFNSTFMTSVFTIKSITPFEHNTRWSCELASNGILIQYDLNVFAPAEIPTCDNATLLNGSSIQIQCLTEKVFPESMCLFYKKTNVSADIKIDEVFIKYKHMRNETTGYYNTKCTYTVSADVIGPGSHMFRVVMYPNITDVNVDMNKSSQYTIPIYLGYPRAALQNDCQNQNYIKENVSSSCTCYDNNTSFLPTQISWSTTQSSKEKLEFLAKRNESFNCTVSNNLKWSNTISFRPQVSYPPEILSVNITKDIFDICHDTNIAISGTCFVSDSNPKPTVYVTINNSSEDITSFKKHLAYPFNSYNASPGIFHISCQANSTEFSSTASKITKTVNIKGPPSFPVIFKNENAEINSHSSNFLKVTTGDLINCQSIGGYPLSKNLSLTCGHEKNFTIDQDQVRLTLNISNTTNGTCECIVWHESDCLQNRTKIKLTFVASENLPVKDQDFEKIYIGVGVTAGCFVIIISLIFIISIIHQGQIKNRTSDMADKLVYNEDIYFIDEEIPGIDMKIYPEYTNVVTTMSSAMEAPKNLKT